MFHVLNRVKKKIKQKKKLPHMYKIKITKKLENISPDNVLNICLYIHLCRCLKIESVKLKPQFDFLNLH